MRELREEGVYIDSCYNNKPFPRYNYRSHFYSIELEISLPIFYGHKNVEKYLGCEMKVEKLFECHQVDKYRRLSMLQVLKNMLCLGGDKGKMVLQN